MAAGLTILDIIKTILPAGTRPGARRWDTVPEWPPDLFAAVATITERSGLYAETAFVAYWSTDFVISREWLEAVQDAGERWAESGTPPQAVKQLWRQLVTDHGGDRIDDISASALKWKTIVFKLLTIADEACSGIGFPPSAPSLQRGDVTGLQYLFYKDFVEWQKKEFAMPGSIGGIVLPYLPHSLCIQVDPAVACVQPKTCTPAVGCTLRSLTHNLALLPSIANVSTHWHLAFEPHEQQDTLNILVVPFPFSIPGKSFSKAKGSFPGSAQDRTFALEPAIWVNGITAADFAQFLLDLIDEARPELEPVHAIVLPETALRKTFAQDVAHILAQRGSLDLFICGVVTDDGPQARNSAAIYRFADKSIVSASFQSKHHRWMLNGDQIRRYHLGHVLDPDSRWWEQIDVSYRNCYMTLFRSRAALTVLVCEDLARYDPVLTVMNAMGPNLVIALLMDGPQLEQRWPGRYATVLAEDPGSAVLTVTSLGMVARSSMPGEPDNREIALWKEPSGKASALKLPRGDHALLVSLTTRLVEQFTLDGRSDGGSTVQLALGAARGVRHRKPPGWL